MKNVLIVESSTNSLIREHSGDGKKDYIMNGIFTEFDVLNRNERVYTANGFLPALNEMNERISTLGSVVGELDHPSNFDFSLSKTSHMITKADYVAEKNHVFGEIKLLSTTWGKEAKALVDDGCPVFVSSRAAGITEANGRVSLKKLFTYDLVADPGFASARMNMVSINESLGYSENTNFRIYEMSNETKIDELMNMNNNDFVSKEQLTDYSMFLAEEINSIKNKLNTAVKEGKIDPAQLEQMMAYYEDLNESNTKITKYLNYLSESIQVVANENKELKQTTKDLIRHNDYLASVLEKATETTEMLEAKIDKVASYSEYIAEHLNKSIGYGEYLAETLDKSIVYSEYIGENLSKTIEFSDYLSESIQGGIEYAEYIAEQLDENIVYSEYLAENLDKSISYQALITEKLNSDVVNENLGSVKINIPTPEEFGFDLEVEVEIEKIEKDAQPEAQEEVVVAEIEEPVAQEEFDEVQAQIDNLEFSQEELEEVEAQDIEVQDIENFEEFDAQEDEEEIQDEFDGDSDSELSAQIDKLIEEAKKRKVSETNDVNFLKFLSKSQVDSYYSLTNEEQEAAKLYINEKSYYSQKDVLSLISESLSLGAESLEDRLIRFMPENVKAIWENLDETNKKSYLSQARLYPESSLMVEAQIDNFWNTRKFKKETPTKKLVDHQALILEDRLTNSEVEAIMERFKNV